MDILTYILSKQYTDSVVSQSGLAGKSAYEIAKENGFVGTEQEWLNSLSPSIGDNGNWFINGEDTGILASPDLEGYYSAKNLAELSQEEILEICKQE